MGKFALRSHSFYRFSKRALGRKSLLSTGKNCRLRPNELLNLIGHILNKTRQFSISLLGVAFFQMPGLFLLTHPVEVAHYA